jgi:predicted phosphodiesterase
MKFTEKGMTFERLDEHRERARRESFDPDTSRFVMLSDAHKWDRGLQDFFQHSEAAYLAALDYYFDNGFTLVLLGDIEEGAGDRFQHVLKEYPRTYVSEERFLINNRYIRVYGNHDHDWKKDDNRKLLADAMGAPGVDVCPALLLGDRIIVVHGHEGDLFSDELHGFTQVILRGFKKLWESFSGGPSAAENSRIRNTRARLLYKWGKAHNMIIIAGHTHSAYFESVSLTRHLHEKIKRLEETVKAGPQAGLKKEESELDQDRKFMVAQDKFWKKDQSLPKGSLPLYFNSGCCKYEYGLTGIEVSDGEIRLIKWIALPGSLPERTPLGNRRLADILARLKP